MPKTRSFLRSTAFLSLFFLNAATSLLCIEGYENKKIEHIQVELKSCAPQAVSDEKLILSRLQTKEGDQFSQFAFDEDLKMLSNDYDGIQPSMRVEEDRVFITIQLAPRPLVRKIEWAGNEHYSSKTLEKELDFSIPTPFNRQKFHKSLNKLKEFYIKKGYFESQITYALRPVAGVDEIDLIIDIREGKPGNIEQIIFNGFTSAERKDLTSVMYLQKYNFLLSWLTGAGKFREEALEQDRVTILTYLQNKGYADACVDIQLSENPKTEKLIIEITAEKGQSYRLGEITICGNTLISTEELLQKVGVASGETFSPDRIRDAAGVLKELYGRKGYIDANVQYETNLKETDPVFDVEFFIEEGEKYKIGLIHIFGNCLTQNNVILRESLLVPGDTFNSEQLKSTQQRLEALGYFKSVNVYAVRPDEETAENYRDVYIEVEETPTGNVGLNMGFSSVEDVFGGLDLMERNFNIAGIGRALRGRISALRGGGQFLSAKATIGKKEDNLLLTWVNPYINDSYWRFGVELSRTFSELQSEDSTVRTYGGSVFANYPLSNSWTFGTRQRLRHSYNTLHLHNPDNSPEAAASIEEEKEKNAGAGLLSAFSLNLSFNSTDRIQKPHKGWASYLEGEVTGIGGSFKFMKFSYLNAVYIPLWERGTFKLRGDLKFILPYGNKSDSENVPYSERLFLGGIGTVRGYKPYILGPKIVIQDKEGKDNPTNTPRGGLSSCLLSAELYQELLPMIDCFLFFDAGSVSFDHWKIDTLRCAVGAGVQLEIANRAPIILGYGFPLNPETNRDRQKFFFSMGGQF